MLTAAMKAKNTTPTLWKSPPKAIAPYQNSPNDSAKKSSTSTYISDRSSSAKRIFVPRSPQLDHFINQHRHRSAQKIPLSSRFLQSLRTNVIDEHQKVPTKKERV